MWCAEKRNIFIHTISKVLPAKKKEYVDLGDSLRALNVLPAWLIILEKIAHPLISGSIQRKLHIKQFGFKEESDCNLAKYMMIYNTVEKGLVK